MKLQNLTNSSGLANFGDVKSLRCISRQSVHAILFGGLQRYTCCFMNTFMMPFQLSPVATLNKVRKAIPKLLKCACSPKPWHGCSSLHSVKIVFIFMLKVNYSYQLKIINNCTFMLINTVVFKNIR